MAKLLIIADNIVDNNNNGWLFLRNTNEENDNMIEKKHVTIMNLKKDNQIESKQVDVAMAIAFIKDPNLVQLLINSLDNQKTFMIKNNQESTATILKPIEIIKALAKISEEPSIEVGDDEHSNDINKKLINQIVDSTLPVKLTEIEELKKILNKEELMKLLNNKSKIATQWKLTEAINQLKLSENEFKKRKDKPIRTISKIFKHNEILDQYYFTDNQLLNIKYCIDYCKDHPRTQNKVSKNEEEKEIST